MNTPQLPRIPHFFALAAAFFATGCADRAAPSSASSTPSSAAPTPAPTPAAPSQSSTTASPAPATSPPGPARNPYEGLRDLALFSRVPANANPRISGDPTIHAILVDWTISKNATATLMCSADGSASIYTSTGGGVIGAGQHQQVREAATRLFQLALELRSHLLPVTAPSLPDIKEMRFTLATDEGLISALANVDELKKGGHALGPLANQVQVVIAAIRATSPQKK